MHTTMCNALHGASKKFIRLRFCFHIRRCFFKLPELSVNKYEMFYGALNDLDSEKLRVPETASMIFSLVDIYSNLQPYVDGWIVVLNAKGFAFGHFVKLTTNLGVIKKAISYVQVSIRRSKMKIISLVGKNRHGEFIIIFIFSFIRMDDDWTV